MFDAIDVSKWQGAVNWADVKKAGISHAMLRAGYGNSVKQIDPQFKRNAAQCITLGIDWGVYWYSYATSPEQARQEARCCLQAIEGLNPTMPVAYDIEYEPGILALSNAQRTAMVKAFLEEVEAAGYYGILYASTDFIRNRLNWRELTQYDVWAAQYGSRCTCPLPFGIWQYSSSNPLGIPGYGKSLDCNHVYKDYPSIIQSTGLNGFTAPDPNPAPDLSTMRQILTIGPVTMGDALQIQALCESLGITGENELYTSQWNDTEKMLQTITIGPVSSGDAWYIMRLCERLQLTGQGLYFSKYAV